MAEKVKSVYHIREIWALWKSKGLFPNKVEIQFYMDTWDVFSEEEISDPVMRRYN